MPTNRFLKCLFAFILAAPPILLAQDDFRGTWYFNGIVGEATDQDNATPAVSSGTVTINENSVTFNLPGRVFTEQVSTWACSFSGLNNSQVFDYYHKSPTRQVTLTDISEAVGTPDDTWYIRREESSREVEVPTFAIRLTVSWLDADTLLIAYNKTDYDDEVWSFDDPEVVTITDDEGVPSQVTRSRTLSNFAISISRNECILGVLTRTPTQLKTSNINWDFAGLAEGVRVSGPSFPSTDPNFLETDYGMATSFESFAIETEKGPTAVQLLYVSLQTPSGVEFQPYPIVNGVASLFVDETQGRLNEFATNISSILSEVIFPLDNGGLVSALFFSSIDEYSFHESYSFRTLNEFDGGLYVMSPRPSPIPGSEQSVSIAKAVELYWFGELGKFYQVQRSTSMESNAWSNLGGPIEGTGAELNTFDSTRTRPTGFYRVVEVE